MANITIWSLRREPKTLPAFTIVSVLSIVVTSSFYGVFLAEERFSPEGRWFSRNSGCQDVAVLPQIRVWVSLLFVLSFGFCTFACGTLAGILYLHARKDYTPSSFRSLCSCTLLSRRPSFCIYNSNSRVRFYFWSFFLARVIGLDYAPIDSPTLTSFGNYAHRMLW